MRVLGIDPGRMTGYAYAQLRDGHLYFNPSQSIDDVDELWQRLWEFKPNVIVMEDFEFRGKARTGLDLFPCQLIGVTRLYELVSPAVPMGENGNNTASPDHLRTVSLYLQKAAEGKSYYTDNMLKQNNWYKRGVPHGMDATRHLLHWTSFKAGYQYINGNDRNFATLLDKSDEWQPAILTEPTTAKE